MSIKTVTADELRRMNGAEGLSLQGCGSYDEALCIIGEYVNITGDYESEDIDGEITMGGIQL